MLRIAVVGHVEHVTLGRISAFPTPGDIVHFSKKHVLFGGGGGLAFAQLSRSDAEIHFFTAAGEDEAGAFVVNALRRSGAHIHCATRATAHPRVVVVVDGRGRRTIFVPEPPLQPAGSDPLPWETLATCDAVYFTGADAETMQHARNARLLVTTARRANVLDAADVVADVVVGSRQDPRENMPIEVYRRTPNAIVLTDGGRTTRIVRTGGVTNVAAPERVDKVVGDYGAGDSFAAALTYFLARGETLEAAVALGGPYGAAVLAHESPLDSTAFLGPG